MMHSFTENVTKHLGWSLSVCRKRHLDSVDSCTLAMCGCACVCVYVNGHSLLSDEPAAADNPWCKENDEFRCTGKSDMSCRSKTIPALARPSYAPVQSTQTHNSMSLTLSAAEWIWYKHQPFSTSSPRIHIIILSTYLPKSCDKF